MPTIVPSWIPWVKEITWLTQPWVWFKEIIMFRKVEAILLGIAWPLSRPNITTL